jgi:antirestriction protein ArdC
MTTTTDRSELLANLSEGIAKLATSDEWQRYLDCQSRFYRYSPNNVMLIAQQRHEATMIAGFNAWKKHGRSVRKGEKAIWILAPMVYKASADETSEESERVIRGFKWVPVFDIASTDGADLPTVCQKLTDDDPAGLFSRLADVAHSIGFTVADTELPGSRNGDCSHATHRIRIETQNSPAQRVKTLAHEIGHALLHEQCKNRALAELEAESTAYVVCNALGLDTSDYSFGYVATWAGGGDQAIAGIKGSCDRIQKAASTILRPFGAGEQEEAA